MGTYDTVVREKIRKEKVTLATNATGTMATTVPIQGEIVKLFYDRNSSILTTVDIDVTDNDTGEVIWTADNVTSDTKTLYPLVNMSGTGGDVLSGEYGRVHSHTVKIAVAEGGDSKTGYLTIFYR